MAGPGTAASEWFLMVETSDVDGPSAMPQGKFRIFDKIIVIQDGRSLAIRRSLGGRQRLHAAGRPERGESAGPAAVPSA